MSETFLVTDTHPLIWYLANQDKKLPKKVLAAFKSAEEASGTHIWVPVAVAWELSLLMRKTDRIKLTVPFEELVRENFHFKSLTLIELEPDDLIIAHGLPFNRDPFDALIAATALRLELPLMTADADITDSKTCAIFWE